MVFRLPWFSSNFWKFFYLERYFKPRLLRGTKPNSYWTEKHVRNSDDRNSGIGMRDSREKGAGMWDHDSLSRPYAYCGCFLVSKQSWRSSVCWSTWCFTWESDNQCWSDRDWPEGSAERFYGSCSLLRTEKINVKYIHYYKKCRVTSTNLSLCCWVVHYGPSICWLFRLQSKTAYFFLKTGRFDTKLFRFKSFRYELKWWNFDHFKYSLRVNKLQSKRLCIQMTVNHFSLSWLKPRANRRIIVGQQLPSLLDVRRCIRLLSLLHVVACCWELVRKVWNWSNF